MPVGQFRDRLGSPLAQASATGSATGSATNKRGFDSFGAVTYGDFSPRVPATLGLAPTTLRGFTGHEHVESARVIHMNGRIYDPKLGRFYSVDPVIQFPANSQSLNLYSYILNNPLSGRDPSGFATCASTEVASESACSEVGVHTITGEGGKKSTLVVGQKGDNIAFSGKMDVSNFKKISPGLNVALNPSNGAENWVKNGPSGSKDVDKIGVSSERGKGCSGDAQCYNVTRGKESGIVESFERTNSVSERNGAVNGISNSIGRALQLMSDHVNFRFGANSYMLVYNPTEGALRDIIETTLDKLGRTTAITRGFAGVLSSVSHPMNWVAHSQGGVIFSEAVRYSLANGVTDLRNNTVAFHSGANNAWVTNGYLSQAGVGLHEKGYFDASNDLVPQLIGLRGLFRPDRMLWSVVSAPLLFTDKSPHTHAQP